MNDWLSFHTAVAFILGVMLSAMVKGWVSTAKAKI